MKTEGRSTHFAIGYNKSMNISLTHFGYKNTTHDKRYKKVEPFKPVVGNFGIDNLELAKKAMRKNNEPFKTSNQDYSWIKPIMY